MDGRTDGQTDRPKPICPLNFFETLQSTVEEKIKKKKRRRERKMDLQVANPTEYNERKNKNGTQ